MIFLPLMFITPMFIPLEAMTSWMAAVASYNPVTYLLAARRSIISDGWRVGAIAEGLPATTGITSVSLTLALTAPKGRVSRS